MNSVIKSAVILLALVLGVVLAWGFVDGLAIQDPGVTCDVGVGESFCW